MAAFEGSSGAKIAGVEQSLSGLCEDLARHKVEITCAIVGGLLTEPTFHANTLRLELLAHIIVRNARGRAEPRRRSISRWLNDELGSIRIVRLEDPVEDVFISNVVSKRGNHRIFEGIWESNDFWAQEVLDVLYSAPDEEPFITLRHQVESLLVISDEVASRTNLGRFTMGGGRAKQSLELPNNAALRNVAQRVTFRESELSQLALSLSALEPFVSNLDDFGDMAEQSIGNTTLERRPLVRFADILVLAVPAAVSLSVRRHVIETLKTEGQLANFSRALRSKQLGYAIYHGLESLGTSPIKPDLPTTTAALPPFQQTVCEFDRGKYAHLIVLYDSLHKAVAEGVCSMAELPQASIGALAQYLGACSQKLASQPGYSGGLTLIVYGGIGRGGIVGLPEFPDRWSWLSFRLPDFLLLGGSQGVSLLQLWKLKQQQEAFDRMGIQFGNINGDLNFYAYWQRQDYYLVPKEVPFGPGRLSIGTDFVAEFRHSLREAYDQHSVLRGAPEESVAVERIHPVPMFADQRRRTYANRDEAIDRILHAAVETPTRGWWLLSQQKYSGGSQRSIQLQIWDAILTWLEPLADILERRIPHIPAGPIHFELVFEELDRWDGAKIEAMPPSDPRVCVDAIKRIVTLTLPMNFLALFGEARNIAERTILEQFVAGLANICDWRVSSTEVTGIVREVLPDEDTRCFHMFRAENFRDFMLADEWPKRKPRFIREEEIALLKTGLAWSVVGDRAQQQIIGTSECQKFLNAIVDVLWQRAVARLKRIDRKSMLVRCLTNIDACELDHRQWKSTARAFLATHGRHKEVTDAALERDTRRNISTMASRILIEMGICECPLSGGNVVSEEDFDALLADLEVLIETAAQSDIVSSGLVAKPVRITLYPNGQFDVPSTFYRDVVLPYMSGNFRVGFIAAADKPSIDYASGAQLKHEPVPLDPNFIAAFEEEFGLAPEPLFSVVECLEEAARIKGKIYFEAGHGELSSIIRHGTGRSQNQIDAVLKRFSLWPRKEWAAKEEGFTTKDIEPWGFGRRLALIARPFLKITDQEGIWIIHPAIIRDYLLHSVSEIHEARYRRDYFHSNQMRAWSDRRRNELGSNFNMIVAEEFRKLGWQARASVKMQEVGAPSDPDLGDVDVLAWRPDGSIFVTECKRLKAARNATQIVNRLKEFRGEIGDDLDRHLTRFRWLSDNVTRVTRITGCPSTKPCLKPLLVTNTSVPMQYMTNLPIPNRSIGPVTSLEDLIAANLV